MKNACWVLLGLGVLALLFGMVGKLLPAQQFIGFLPIAWWRLAMALALLAIALKIVGGKD